MASRNSIALRTELNADECLRRLQEGTDLGVRTIASFSGYKGKKPVLSRFDGHRFRLWKRRYYRNDFAPIIFGEVHPEGRGSRIEGRFGIQGFVRILHAAWLGFVGLLGLTMVSSALSRGRTGDVGSAITILGGLFFFGLLMPKAGRFIGRGEERNLREFLEETLAARTVDPGSLDSSPVIENRPLG
jgi:hypothetical protein